MCTPGECLYALVHDQIVQFLFSVTTRYRGFILGIHLHLMKTNRNQLTVSDVDLYFMVHCT